MRHASESTRHTRIGPAPVRARLAAAAILWIQLPLAACGPTARVTISLEPARDAAGSPYDTSSLRTLTIHVKTGDEGPLRFGTIALVRDVRQRLPPLEVDTLQPLSLDVWGCSGDDPCASETVTFRGCTPTPVKPRDDRDVEIRILMLPAEDDRLAGCPLFR